MNQKRINFGKLVKVLGDLALFNFAGSSMWFVNKNGLTKQDQGCVYCIQTDVDTKTIKYFDVEDNDNLHPASLELIETLPVLKLLQVNLLTT